MAFAAGSCSRQTPAATTADRHRNDRIQRTTEPSRPYSTSESYTLVNENFRTVLWTGSNLQVTVMAIPSAATSGLGCTQHRPVPACGGRYSAR